MFGLSSITVSTLFYLCCIPGQSWHICQEKVNELARAGSVQSEEEILWGLSGCGICDIDRINLN